MGLQSIAKTGIRNVLICELGRKIERSIKFPVKIIITLSRNFLDKEIPSNPPLKIMIEDGTIWPQ